MTFKAREVLSDCREALALLEDDTENSRWRVHWAAAVALIRAVGHVLANVDGADPIIGNATDAAFRRWKSADLDHEIFREFIERERNNLLKEYHSDVHPLSEVSLAFELLAKPIAGGDSIVIRDVAEIDENIYRPMLDGPWEGDDARDVLTAAIEWWERQLDAIDGEVRAARAR
jgi:hypothetical protein